MEFLLFVFGVFTLGVAWRARNEAREARRIANKLQQELATLRDALPAASTKPMPTTPDAVVVARSAQAAAQPKPPTSVAPAAAEPATPSESLATPEPLAHVAPEESLAEAALAVGAAATASSVPDAETLPADVPETPRLPIRTPPPPSQPPKWLLAAKTWLFGGNLVAKLGLLILFIGVSFLLKYTAARVTLPIEFRLAGIVLADIAALAWAWRIRLRRPAISLPVQGAALAVLMLVTFGAFRLYHLIPGGMAFALLLVLTVFTCLLAVLQDAMWLAIFGIVGGFATPILASSGGGSHIGLFSYYALLNAGVLYLALYRSWRPLNLLGFAFTFAIGTTWGVLRYTPENYLSVQLFLLLFFAFYVSIPLAYARQQSVKLKNYVDGTLVFGTPMAGFGLQFSLVKDMQFGVAFSALTLGLFYIGLTTMLRRRPKLALLSDAFLALGVVFGTLAIPFALDGRWTSGAWALEGAGIVWIGLRQKQKMAWMFGLLVQAGAWISFFGTVTGLSPQLAIESNLWLGFILLSITAFLMATRFRAQDDSSTRLFAMLASVFLAFASVWLIAGAWTEIFLRTNGVAQANLLVISALLASLVLYFIARKMTWRLASTLALVAQAIVGVMLGVLVSLEVLFSQQGDWLHVSPNLFDKPILGALLICAAGLFSSWALMRNNGAKPGTVNHALSRITMLWGGLWWYIMSAPDLAGWLAVRYELLSKDNWYGADVLAMAVYGMLVAASAIPATLLAKRLQWPSLRVLATPAWIGLAVATAGMLVQLYFDNHLPRASVWLAYAALWLAGEWMLRLWPANGWQLGAVPLRLVHSLRTGGLWLMIWPVAAIWITRWLHGGDSEEARMLAEAGWETSASWARFIPAWLMMGVIGWLMQRSRAGTWPVAPIAEWYQRRLTPLACTWALLLVAVWNLSQNGAMAPLPYLPLANPLDLTTCFALLLANSCYRLLHQTPATLLPAWVLPLAGALVAYGWFNLALLRTVSNYMNIPYEFDAMFGSQFVQAMLSLVWSVTALLLMRFAAKRSIRTVWIGGATLLALVVAKLFLVDLSNVGGVERIVSFVGVGALMVGIGYLAPYPTQTENTAETA
ncbi:DUF2339 domain-containing protein [Pseudoduganella sp. FT25W]|uniref:DUF2339 domain-containing protein n=1 Tax=Duganella alba TaxID=2666081 RepID=A0A6L5QEW8_9BURK|nr:DUF2339 domain-containing protein [Duganella alba]MRX08068.1 DUF2339 domain-containing protein [Duganella alba]MRX16395.1 DUF2339 domain-containing protein [Duganella alba]